MAVYKIASGGESDFIIVAHQYADETVRYAASQLQEYLLRATGAAIPYFSDRCPMRSAEIRIGADVRGETKTETDLHDEGFYIRGAGEHITITGRTSRGVLYGVYRFLEIFCGYRCFTKDVETIDTFDVLEIELDEIKEEPAFDFRDAYFRNAFDGGFSSKNRLNSGLCDLSKAKGGRMKWFNFHHSFCDLVPEGKYFDSHPEYFSEVNGVRTRDSQLCLTNPDVLKIAEETLRSWIKNNPECTVFSVAQNDNPHRCTCADCMAIENEEGSPAGPIIRFVNKLADSIKEDYPDVLLHTFAYMYSVPAPKKAVAGDNVIVRICSIDCRYDRPFELSAELEPDGRDAQFVNALNDWKSHAKQLYVWDYATNFENYLQPFIHFDTLAENIRFFRRIGIKGVLEQGNFAYGGGASCDDLKAYIIARLLWNPDTDIHREIRRFCTAVYGGESGKYMEDYVELMQNACSSSKLTIYMHPDAEFITDELVEKADTLFKKAMASATTDEIRKRIDREHLAVRFLQLTRMAMDVPHRTEQIDRFFKDVKSLGITEIMERTSLKVSYECMKCCMYAKEFPINYRLYYIMQ
ncbi:MAG: DUF4838 domain-containing protein [Clostridia bacterium]|nr:DUF4838 domain-containing protein [Clostridia bacterium]